MDPEKRKGELPEDGAAEAERAGGREEQGHGAPRAAGSDAEIERREEQGYDQPESSAQKRPRRPEDETLGE